MKNSLKVKALHDAAVYASEMTPDKLAMSESWRVKIVAAGDLLLDWDRKRMCQILDRMDRQFGDFIYSS